MISIACKGANAKEKSFFVHKDLPTFVDGVDILDILCPVSKKTGLRENPLSLIRKLITDPAKQALLAQCLAEIPTDNSQNMLSEEEKFEFCMQRLQCGTPAENEVYAEHLRSVLDLAADAAKAQVVKEKHDVIQSTSQDIPVSSSVES